MNMRKKDYTAPLTEKIHFDGGLQILAGTEQSPWAEGKSESGFDGDDDGSWVDRNPWGASPASRDIWE